MDSPKVGLCLAFVVLLAGCGGPAVESVTPSTTPSTTEAANPTTSTPTYTPTYQLRVENSLNHSVEVRLIFRDASNGTVFYNETRTVGPSDHATFVDAIGSRDAFEFTVRLGDASVTRTVSNAQQGYEVAVVGETELAVRETASP